MAENRIAVIDGLRGLAALAVCVFHAGLQLPAGFLKAITSYGFLGIEVFFVISGFIIPYALYTGGYHLRIDFFRFMAKRLLRLEPPYLVSIIMVLVVLQLVGLANEGQSSGPDWSVTQLVLHLGYLNAFTEYKWLSPVYWSLAVEFQFYIVMALLFPFFAHRSEIVRILVLLGFCGLALVSNEQASIFRFLPLFCIGILLFHDRAGIIGRKKFILLLLLFTVATGLQIHWPAAAAGLFSALAIKYWTAPVPRIVGFLGAISYSLYLVHYIINKRTANVLMSVGVDRYAAVGLGVMASIFVAYLLYISVEKPSQRWASSIRFGKRREMKKDS